MTPNPRTATNRVLVLGAGELGMAVLRSLSERAAPTSETTLSVLLNLPQAVHTSASRPSRDAELQSLGVEVVRADLVSRTVEDLSSTFSRFDTVICCTGFVAGSGTQRKITTAVLQARVRRYVPWQFGVDYDAVGRGSGQDVWDEQLDVRGLLRGQTTTEWVIISTGMFTSFLFEPSFGVVDLDSGRVQALGHLDNRITVTTPDDIGRLTGDILFADPKIVDQVVFIGGDTLSYAGLADTVEEVLGRTVERVVRTVAELRKDLEVRPDDAMSKYRLAFARGTGVAWDIEGTFNAEHGIQVTDVASWIRGNLS